jgi:hypothetical protein
MESTNTTTLDEMAQATPARPQFLTVLCILTWIACGLMFITSVWGILFKPSADEQYEQVEKIREVSPEAAENMEALIEKQNSSTQLLNTALSLVGIGLSAFGAYLMWQMRRRGFYMYLGGELLPYLGFLFAGDEAMAAMNFFGPNGAVMIIGGMVLLDAVFIALYAMNLKYMTRA